MQKAQNNVPKGTEKADLVLLHQQCIIYHTYDKLSRYEKVYTNYREIKMKGLSKQAFRKQ